MLWRVSGYVTISFSGDNLQKFLNECRRENIEIHNIRKQSGRVFAQISNLMLKKVYSVAKKSSIEFKINGRGGLYVKLLNLRKRKIFVILFFVSLIFFCVKLNLVSKINISGNTVLTDSELVMLLGDCGVREGAYIGGIDCDKVSREMVKKDGALSWAWVEKKGNEIFVDVREKEAKPEFDNDKSPCNIVAKCDGVIVNAISGCGVLSVSKDSYVRAGELLISGVYDSNNYAPIRFVHAYGKVKAKTTHSMECRFPLKYFKFSDTKLKSKTTVNFMSYGIEFATGHKKNNILFNSSSKIIKNSIKFYLPLTFTKSKYCEIIKEECSSDGDETKKKAGEYLKYMILSDLSQDASVVDSKFECLGEDENFLYAKLTLTCIEDICEELPIDISYKKSEDKGIGESNQY